MRKDILGRWPVLFLAVLFVKAIFFCLDPIPKFFFGDSGCYVYSALTDFVPEDRSFTYGWVIAPLIEHFDTLTPLLLVQLMASTMTAFLLGISLEKVFNIRRRIAWGAALLCSAEPIQLLYERYVMTETLSLFLFATYTLTAFHYLCRRNASILVLLQTLGVLMVSLRLSYLPVVMGNTVLLPLLGACPRGQGSAPTEQMTPSVSPARKRLGPAFRTVSHLAVSLLAMVSLHSGLKWLYSDLTGCPAGYHASEGYFLLATWAPVVVPEDFPLAEARSAIFDQPTFDLRNRHLRTQQLFDHDGLCWRIRFALEEFEAEDEDSEKNGVADGLARTTAMNALKRDPIGLARLSLQSLADFYDVALLQTVILNDLAMDDDQIALYRQFARDTEEVLQGTLNPLEQPMTPLKRYYRVMLPWYWLLLATPILCAGALTLTRGLERLMVLELLLATSACAAVAGFLSILPIVRYLHPLAWLAFYPLTLVVDRLTRPLKRPRNRLRDVE